jgi:hypothetical protein
VNRGRQGESKQAGGAQFLFGCARAWDANTAGKRVALG